MLIKKLIVFLALFRKHYFYCFFFIIIQFTGRNIPSLVFVALVRSQFSLWHSLVSHRQLL